MYVYGRVRACPAGVKRTPSWDAHGGGTENLNRRGLDDPGSGESGLEHTKLYGAGGWVGGAPESVEWRA